MKKRMIALVLAVVLAMGLLAGCGGSSGGAAEGETEATTNVTNSADGPTIGILWYSNTDPLGKQVYTIVNAAAEELGVNVMWEIGKFDNDAQLTSIQNLISAGVDGIILQPMDASFIPKAMELCDDAGIYMSVQFSDILDKEIEEEANQSKYFLGRTHADEAANAAALVDALHEIGCNNLGVGYATPGNDLADQRNQGTDEEMAKLGMNKVAEYTNPMDNNVNTVSTNVQNFLSAYPDMDGIVINSLAGGIGEAVDKLLETDTKGVKFAGIQDFEGMEQSFASGHLAAVACGWCADGLYNFMLMYNAIQGTPISDSPVEWKIPACIIKSEDEAKTFNEYMGDMTNIVEKVYTADFVESLNKANNPELTSEDIQNTINEFSIEWIQQQAAK